MLKWRSKILFLKGSCIGTPLDIVNEYPASDTSYILAWKALNNRYHNKRRIVDTILCKLFSVPVSNGSSDSIQHILDTTRNCIALLRTLDISTDGWDAILIYMTVNKHDIQTRKEWEQSLKASFEIPSIKDLFCFLETTFRTLETINEPYPTHYTSTSSKVNSSNSYFNISKTNRRNVHISTAKCFQFAAMSSDSKREFIKTKKICRNCLNVGHFSYNCQVQSRCQICHQAHHTTLHNDCAEY